jgi:hypothetical protein
MIIIEFASAYPTPLVVALWAGHMIATLSFFDSHMTFRAVRHIGVLKPFIVNNSGIHITTLKVFVSFPFDLAFSTEFKVAMLAPRKCHLLFITFSYLRALRIRAIYPVFTKRYF